MKRLLLLIGFVFIPLIVSANTSDFAQFQADQGSEWRVSWNADGTIRSIYGKGTKSYSSPESAAQHFLSDYSSLLGIRKVSDLRMESAEPSDSGTDFSFQQYYRGLPVAGGYVSVHIDERNRIISATNEYKNDLVGEVASSDSLQAAREAAKNLVTYGIAAPTADLMVLNTGDHQARPVWRIEVDSARLAGGSWLVYVDARRPNLLYLPRKTFADFDGQGNVWEQNPIVTPARQFETLPKLDDSTKLSGSYAKIFDANFVHTAFDDSHLSEYTTASDPNRRYDYPEGDARLTEAMAYFHINRVHDQWNMFGFKKLNAKAPIFVNVAEKEGGPGFDNAFYSRSFRHRRTGIYVFGSGQQLFNFGLDSDVYYHEYGHGVLDHTKPHFFEAQETNYPGSFHEAFGDISAAAITENPKLGEYALRLKSSHKFIGRNLRNHRRFPHDVVLPGWNASEVHWTGEIAGGAWWDLEQKIGSFEAQKILYRSLSLLPSKEFDFFDFRDAMLAADENLNQGKNHTAIEDAFAKHGLSGEDPGQPGMANVTNLTTARWNTHTDARKLSKTFKKGDYILAFLGYSTTSNLIPGYNFVPVDAELTGPCDSCVVVITFADEARKGSYNNLNGAIQALLFTRDAVAGNYTLTLKTRLGGTNQVSPVMTAHFTIRK